MRSFRYILILSLFFTQFIIAQNVSKRSDIIEMYKGESYYMHFVAQGETVQSLAQLYGVTNVEILKANPEISSGLQPNKIVRIPVKSIESGGDKQNQSIQQATDETFHLVQPKETWYGIARLYKLPVKDLINANSDIDTLRIGMEIRVPQSTGKQRVITGNYAEHTVKGKETLYSLAKRYNTSVEELMRLNPFLSDGLKVGQILMIPVSEIGGDTNLKLQISDTSFIEHKVERKETLYSISKLYNADQNEILKANPGLDGKIRKGDILKIPKVFKSVKAYTRPDTVIMGRQIDQMAIHRESIGPCAKVHPNTDIFNIALMVPMQLELVDSISVSDPSGLKSANEYVSFDFIQFYEGAVIAADSMARAGMKIKLFVYDVDHGDRVQKTKKVLSNPEMAYMDLIIGPFFAESFNLVASYAKQNKIPVINPLSQRSEITKNNEYIIKMQPSKWAQYNTLGTYLYSHHLNDNILLVRKNSDENTSMVKVLKSALSIDSLLPSKYKEVIYNSAGWSGISKNLSSTKANIVVLMINDKAILPALLRDLADRADSENISVVGMPEWEEMELDYNYLIKLNTHFYNPWFIDYQHAASKHFVTMFRERFIAEPEIDRFAFLGYDATLYFLQSLNDYGKNFLNCIESTNRKGLSSDFKFIRTPGGGIENYGTSIFKYTDFKREKLN